MEKRTTIEKCKVFFTEDELKEISELLARKLNELETAEDGKKEVAAQFKAQIDALTNEVRLYGSHVRNKFEYRDVKCDVRVNVNGGTVEFWRQDTGELHRTRKATSADLQESMEV